MPIDLSKISGIAGTGALGATAVKAFLPTPFKITSIRPYTKIGEKINYISDSFLFNTIGEESTTYEAEITDYYLEDLSPVQDHIALKPVTISIKGFIAEASSEPPDLIKYLADYVQKLSVLSAFAPALTASAMSTFNSVQSIYSNIAKVTDVYGQLSGNKSITKQTKAFNSLVDWMQDKLFFEVQTPYRLYNDMVIQSLVATQDDTTDQVSDFALTMKQIMFAQTLNVASTKVKRLSNKAKAIEDKGTTKGEASLLRNLTTK